MEVAEFWLKSIDQAIKDVGGKRAQGENCKSYARLTGTPEFMASHTDWAAQYIQDTCVIVHGSEAPKVLGVHIGSGEDAAADMRKICEKTEQQRNGVQEMNSTPAELTLQRCCLNLGKASYMLRCKGDLVASEASCIFDGGMAGGR